MEFNRETLEAGIKHYDTFGSMPSREFADAVFGLAKQALVEPVPKKAKATKE